MRETAQPKVIPTEPVKSLGVNGTTDKITFQHWIELGGSTWQYLVHDLSDERTSRWPLMSNPLPTIAIITAWYLFVKKLGPMFMKNRKPYELNNLLVVYNFIQVCVSTLIVSECIQLYTFKYSFWRCESVDRSYSDESMRICKGFYLYYLAKLSELLDTVFFVLRKKYNQITFLHVYHHAGMPMLSWSVTKYYPGGHAAFIGFVNSFVHIVMYFYYMLAAMGPKIQKYLWWKKWITILQLAQFAVAFFHFMQVLNPSCNYPKWAVIIVFPNAFFLYYLFWDFYQKAYKNKLAKVDEDKLLTSKSSSSLDCSGAVVANGDDPIQSTIRKRNAETGICGD